MSERLKLDREDGIKLAKSFGLSMAGAVLVWIAQVAIPGIDWESARWGPFVGAMAPFAVNVLRKLLSTQ